VQNRCEALGFEHVTTLRGVSALKTNFLILTIGLACSTIAATDAVARQGNQNSIKPALFPASPIIAPPAVPAQFNVVGHIQDAIVDPSVCTDSSSNLDPRLYGGRVTVDNVEVIIPCNTILQMPATSLTWAELFDPSLIPAETKSNTGLALADQGMTHGFPKPGQVNSLPLPAFEIHIQGNIVKGKRIAGLVFISQQSLNIGQGYIKSIDYATGELCVSSGAPVNGFQGQTEISPVCTSPNARVRLNDSIGRFGLKHGSPGCKAQGTCDVEESHYDPRFTVDTDNPTIHAATGFPMCIPRAFPFGTDGDTDALCPQQNRPIQGNGNACTNLPTINGVAFPAFPAQNDGYCHSFVMNPLPTDQVPPPGPCGTIIDSSGASNVIPCATRPDRQAPFEIGDYIDYSGTLLIDSNVANSTVSPYYISAHTINAHVGIYTYPGTKPVYVMIEDLLAGTSGLPLNNIPQEVTSRMKMVGFTTDPSSMIDIFAMDVDKQTGAVTDRLLGSVNPSGPPVVGRGIFFPLSGSFTPPTRNVRIVSRTLCTSKTQPCYMPQVSLDPNNPAGKYANGLVAGQYNAPNFEYIFAENLFSGDPVLPDNFQDLPFLACGSGPLTTVTAGKNPPIVGTLDPAPWDAPMPPPNQCAGKLVNQLTIPVTQTPDKVTIFTATWDNRVNKGKLTVSASSSLPNTTPNLQLYVQATDQFGVTMASNPQPMRLVTNPAVIAADVVPPCVPINPCWQYIASGTIVDPAHANGGDPSQPGNIFAAPVKVTVYSSRGGQSSALPPGLNKPIDLPGSPLKLKCAVFNGQNTCF
jgi:hypothetical protein